MLEAIKTVLAPLLIETGSEEVGSDNGRNRRIMPPSRGGAPR